MNANGRHPKNKKSSEDYKFTRGFVSATPFSAALGVTVDW
jgi:hypothetical protein